jgi:glutamate racemase
VVPAIKPAAQITQSKHIALLATPATVSSAYTHKLIHEYAANIKVNLYSSVELVSLAEQYFFTQRLDTTKLYRELDRLAIDSRVDVLILGCTHFPILAAPIRQYFRAKVKLVDSGAAIAKRVSYLLEHSNLKRDNSAAIKKPLQCYATAAIASNRLPIKLVTLIDPTQHVQN